MLYRILRGSGLAGLSGILPVTNEGLVRPLLEIDRPEIEAWLREHRIAWREDDTNQDRAYARNRLRHEILPLLRDTFNPQLDKPSRTWLHWPATKKSTGTARSPAASHQPPATSPWYSSLAR